MSLKKIVSEGDVSAIHKKGLPVHASGAKATEPKKSENKKMEVAATAKAKSDLPTHGSDAKKTEPADEMKKKAPTKVDPEVDGEKIADDMVDGDGVKKTLAGKDGVTKKHSDLASVKEGAGEEDDDDKKDDAAADVDDDDKKDDEEAKEKMKEHVEALVSGEDLSEEFKVKAETIFEAAVNERVANIQKSLKEEYAKNLEESIEANRTELAEQMDSYLNYMAEEYMKENALAVENGIKQEITESFLEGLKDLFEQHNIEIPQEKVDAVGELQEKVSKLEEELNDSLITNKTLKEEVSEMEKESCLRDACESLSDTESEKLRSLSEGLAFDNVEDYKTKIGVLKESYFEQVVSTQYLNEAALVEGKLPEDNISSGRMDSYVQAVSRTIK